MGRYEEALPDPPAGSTAHNNPPAPAYEPTDSYTAHDGAQVVLGTASPFAFPNGPSHPLVAPGDSASILAFPQTRPGPFALLSAYSPMLLRYGITQQSWISFMDAISAFLTAKISSRFVSHAADMARELTERPLISSKGLAARARETGSDIAASARQGNLVGAVIHAVLGTVRLPVSAALSIVGNAASLPGAALGAVFKTPKTPLERAANYVTVANGKWLHERNLHAQLMQTEQLARVIGVAPNEMLETARLSAASLSPNQPLALHPHFETVTCESGGARLQLETSSLWLVVHVASGMRH